MYAYDTTSVYTRRYMWIKIEDELPIHGWCVRVKNGNKIYNATYHRKKWHSWGRKLHKVTEWEKCPVTYPKIPAKDFNDYMKRAQKYRHQMKLKRFIMRPIEDLFGLEK